MQHEWLNQDQSNTLIVFFNGWGMNRESVSHLTENNRLHKDYDVLHFFDYRDCSLPNLDLSRYSEKILIAWSMGVYMSSLFPFECGLKTALCGTGNPIHLKEGIAPKIYQLTIDGFSEKTLPLFQEKTGFRMDSARSAQALKDELIAIKNSSLPKENAFGIAYLAEDDEIFPFKAQKNYWEKHAEKSIVLKSRHYPFSCFSSWTDIIQGKTPYAQQTADTE